MIQTNLEEKRKSDEEVEKESMQKHSTKELELVSLLIDNRERLLEIIEIVKPEYFEYDKFRLIYEALLKKAPNTDELTIGIIDRTIIQHAKTLVASSGSTIKDVALKVKENYLRRKISVLLKKSKRKALSSDSEMMINHLQSELNLINSQIDEKTNASVKYLVPLAIKEMNDFSLNKKKILLPSSFSNLGEITKGIFPHHIWTIGGHSGTGKSFFALQLLSDLLTNSIGDDGKPRLKAVIFSTENSALDNLYRLVGARTGYDFIDIKTNNLNEEQKANVDMHFHDLEDCPLIIYDKIFDANQIISLISMHKLRNECDIVLIDYMQNLNSWEKDIFTQMSKVAMALQQCALSNDISLINVSQLSDNESRETGDKMMSFKGAGEIKNITDVGIWLQKGISPRIRDKYSEKFGSNIENPLFAMRKNPDGSSGFLERDDDEFITAYVNKVRHARPGVAIFEFFTHHCTKTRNRYLWKIDREIPEEEAIDFVNSLG